jgi:GT2 family glycosyltransferase
LEATLVTVIIPSYNRRQELCRCIDSVLAQTSVSIEIIVVDDCSEDDTREFLRLNHPEVRLIPCARRYGPSYLRNLGLRKAKGEFVHFLDSDVVLPNKGIVRRMAENLSHDKAIGEIGGEIPAYLNIMDEARGKRRNFFGKNHNVISKKYERSGNQLKKCTYLATCNCMVRRDVAYEVGGFDPYYKFGGEDADFGLRILKKGYSNIVNYSVGVHHHRSEMGRYPDETFRYHKTRVRLNLKHFTFRRNLFIFFIDLFIFILFHLALVPKVVIKKIKNIPLVSENYWGGYYLLKAYLVNTSKYVELKKLKDINFLCDEEMERFETYTTVL